MPIILENTTVTGTQRISGSGSNYGITQDSTGRVRLPLNPCFRAYGTPSTANGSVIIWSNVLYNIGSNYTQATGRFTAPVAGRYFFAFSNIGANSATVYRYYARINGSVFAGGYHLRLDLIHNDTSDIYGPNGAKTVILNLSANDYVDVQYNADNGTAQYANDSQVFAYFMGYLIG
jgi:hypothetical protein